MKALRLIAIPVLLMAVGTGCYRSIPTATDDLHRPSFIIDQPNSRSIDNVTVHTLQNGLTLIHKRTETNAIVGIVLYIRSGSSLEEPEKNGATNLAMRVITKGTKKRTSDQVAEEIAQLGASLSASAGQDFCRLSIQCISDDLEQAVDLLADVVLNPIFPVEQVDLERQRVLASIRMAEDQASSVASKRFQRELFGTHPYARPTEGTAETLPGILPADLAEIHGNNFVPSNMVMSVVGNVDEAELLSIITKYLGGVAPERRRSYEADKLITPSAKRAELAKQSEQGFVILGHLTCPSGHADEPAVEVAATVLGGGMSSRLFVELRDKQGLAYAVGAGATFLRHNGYLSTYIGTGPDTLDQAEKGLWSQVMRLREEPVTDEELQRAKNYIAGNYLRSHERNMAQAGYLAFWHITGRGVEYDRTYLDAINSVTTRDVMRIANKYLLDPTVVVVRPLPRTAP